MQRRIMTPIAVLIAMLMATMSVVAVGATHTVDGSAHPFADDDFEETWARTDEPVASGEVQRTWIWGPAPYTDGIMEPYEDSPGNQRLVQYFDKSRMEINDPDAFDDGLWYVTNGLLVVEMVEGWYQVGDAEFDMSPEPAAVNVTGDPGDESGLSPTYADINRYGLRDAPARADGSAITQTIDADGNLGVDNDKASFNVTSAHRVQVPGIDHQVASVFWDFMHTVGTVYENGQFVQEPLFESPFYATGYPITEAYWSTVMVNNEERDVLWQCFERRCLTYTPGNPAGFVVEAGNVGQHYYRWRHGGEQPPPETLEYEVQLGSLNGSGVHGSVIVALTGNELVLDVQLSGLEPGDHPWHIHGFGDGMDASCPTIDLDTNQNGFVELDEGAAAYGPVLLSLGALTAGADGVVDTTVTIILTDQQLDGLGDLLDNVIVVHGMTVDLDPEDETEAEYVASLPVACGDVNEVGFSEEAEVFETSFEALNESGVAGTVRVTLINDLLTVTVNLTGLEPGQPHPMHLHGFGDGATDATCPTMEMDTNANGYIELEEGLPAYGGVLVGLGAPMADETGALTFTAAVIVDPATLGSLTHNTVVVHGMTADLDGEGEGEAEYVQSLPVACADLDVPDVAEPAVYTVNLDQVNASGGDAHAMLVLDGDELSIHVQATGLEANAAYIVTLYGLTGGAASCPTADMDADGNGYVDLDEAALAFDNLVQQLGTPVADAEGNLTLDATLTVDPATLGALSDLVVVIHGLTVDEDGEGPGEPVFEPLVPAACGELEASLGEATAEIMDADGATVGTAHLAETADGVLVHVAVTTGVAAGLHGTHVHETGSCVAPDFTSAGGHFNPTGESHPNHLGDLGSLLVAEDGTGSLLALMAGATLGAGPLTVLDADGSAVVIHADADDLQTDPSGNSGARIACGVVAEAGEPS